MSLIDSLPEGAATVRAVLADFYDRVYADVMIGFFFRNADKQRLIDKETELIVAALGGNCVYTGEALRPAHARHPILGGHFLRRLQILKETIADHALPAPVAAEWLAHTEKLRALVTADSGSDCRDSLMDDPSGPPA